MTTGDITVTPKISYKANGADQTPITKDPITVKLSVRDVKMSVSVDNPSPQAGEEVTFTLNLTNDGNMSYSKLKVSLAGEEVDFPASKLKPGDTFTQTYKRSYETSTEVIFSVTMVDQNGEQRPLDKTVTITLPVDASAVSDKLKLIMNVDRPQLTSAGTINFTGYISNATDYDFINLQVTEASLGDVFSTSALAASGQENIKYTADINATTTYNFVLTATDQDGTEYTINAEPITVTVQSVTPTPTNFEEAANVTESADAETSGSFNASKFFLILAIVLVVLILGVGAALFVLWKKGKTSGGRPSGGRPSGGRPSSSGRPAPRPSSPSAPRKNPSAGSGSYGRGPAPRKPSGPSKSYRDRNNF
jgi:flagellar basal body-associated protein FliL